MAGHEMAEATEGPASDQSCLACKRLKRKCSKEIPRCSLCQRVGRKCQYPSNNHADKSTDVTALERRVRELESLLKSSQTPKALGEVQAPATPSSYRTGSTITESPFTGPEHVPSRFASVFLDSVACRYTDFGPSRDIDWPRYEASQFLSGPECLRRIAQEYIQRTHPWLPISQIPGMVSNHRSLF